jgi:hypothetical protein
MKAAVIKSETSPMAPRRIRTDIRLKGGGGGSSAAIGSLDIGEVSRSFLERAFGAEENTLENSMTVYLPPENKSHDHRIPSPGNDDAA